MQANRRIMLERIVGDVASTQVEREEAQRELCEADAIDQRKQDNLLERWIDCDLEDTMSVDNETCALYYALVGPRLGLDLDRRSENLDLLTGLYRRTLSPSLKAAVRQAITHIRNLSNFYVYRDEHAARKAAQFLDHEQRVLARPPAPIRCFR